MDTSSLTTAALATFGSSASASSAHPADLSLQTAIDAACLQACKAIAPAWPLDRSIAVNPHWERIGMPLRQVAARMAVLGGIRVLPPRSYVLQAWNEQRITADDLTYALDALPAAQAAGLTADMCKKALHQALDTPSLPVLVDVLDAAPNRHQRLSWRQAVTHQVSQTCASYFDELQANWQPQRDQDLYTFWRNTLAHDHGIGVLMGLPDLGRLISALPATRADAERWVLQRIGLPEVLWSDYLEAVLLTVNGWASWCAYLGWQARLQGQSAFHLRDLLAIRLAWGAMLLDGKDNASTRQAFAQLQSEWRSAPVRLKAAEAALLVDEVWQLALEAGYQRALAQKLLSASSSTHAAGAPPAVEVQAVFCIDVRSEPMRRALETALPTMQTLGFAGFFGLPAAYTPLATAARRPQLPGLLAPGVEVVDRIVLPPDLVGAVPAEHRLTRVLNASAVHARQRWFAWSDQWLAASRWPGAAFSFVEAAGVGYVGKLTNWLNPSVENRPRDDLAGLPARYRAICRPCVTGLDTAAKVALASNVLYAMGLDNRLAPLVLLVGHGSHTTNNAQAAALDCGACCGQTGEVNARALASLLNELEVRAGLLATGIDVPARTVFVAALHNTTTDEIEGFDLDLSSQAAQATWSRLQKVFADAGDQVRRERAASLGLDPLAGADPLLHTLRKRANDGAQTRPEWGLARNASFVIAPRNRTRAALLDGRSFLHDYAAANDPDGSVLELLMTAPMLVAHWINWQYHASTCEPLYLGSGNKLLHNVVGGSIGVFEGNGGDLRIGLSKQSLHNGDRWVHEPLRLTVVIDAPSHAIERVISNHAAVRQLVDNGWLHLWRFDADTLLRYEGHGWRPLNFETGVSLST